MAFVDSVSAHGDADLEWRRFIAERRTAELGEIIESEQVNAEAPRNMIETAFRERAIPVAGASITTTLPLTRFSLDGRHGEKKSNDIENLAAFFERFFGLGSTDTQLIGAASKHLYLSQEIVRSCFAAQSVGN